MAVYVATQYRILLLWIHTALLVAAAKSYWDQPVLYMEWPARRSGRVC